jgi:uncharacterized DUF497 family protein
MPAVFRPWISPYTDEDFEWNREKSLETFADRDLVFEAARIVFRSTLLRRQDTRRRRSKEPRFMVLGELCRGRGKCRIISLRPANAVEREIYYEHTSA